MRKFLRFSFSMALLAAITAYAMWTADRPVGHYLSDLRIKLAVDQGIRADRGNLLGIQPELFPTDYQSPQRLHRKLAAYLQHARDQGLLNDKTIVVLPEHVGTWLMLSGEKDELYQATSLEEAMNWLAVSNPLKFARALISATGESRLDDAHLRMKAKTMARDYQALFGGLAPLCCLSQPSATVSWKSLAARRYTTARWCSAVTACPSANLSASCRQPRLNGVLSSPASIRQSTSSILRPDALAC
jgi:hypothetical protein